MKIGTSASVIAITGVILATSVTSAGAAAYITGRQIKDGTVTSADIRNGSLGGTDVTDSSLSGADIRNGTITGSDLASGTLRAGATGAQGPVGPQGPAGPAGATGGNGAAGPAGATGGTGADGKDGRDGADGARGPAGEPGPAGSPGRTFHTYTGTSSRQFSYDASLPASPPADPTTWPLILGTTLPANAYEDASVTLSAPYNYNNPDGLTCAVFLDGTLVARGQHDPNSATYPFRFSDVADGYAAWNGQAPTGAEYIGYVSLGSANFPDGAGVEVRCFKAAGVGTSVSATVTAHMPLTKTLDIASDPS